MLTRAVNSLRKLCGVSVASNDELEAHMKNMARDIQSLKSMVVDVVNYMRDAESEVPEKMRRFIMYFHDVHDISNFYHELGLVPPKYIIVEIERCADRYRHLLDELYNDTGTFEKVRQDMSNREGNKYDWTKLIGVKP